MYLHPRKGRIHVFASALSILFLFAIALYLLFSIFLLVFRIFIGGFGTIPRVKEHVLVAFENEQGD